MERTTIINIDKIEKIVRKFLEVKQYAKDSMAVKKSNKRCDHKLSIIDHHSADTICTLCGLVLEEGLSYQEIHYKM